MRRFTSSWLCFLFTCVLVIPTQAQDEKDKNAIKVDLAYYQLDNALPILVASAKTKNGKKFEPVDSVDIYLYFNEESTVGFIGKIRTNDKGIGKLSLPERFRSDWATLPSSTFIATITGNERFKDASTEIEIAKAKIELTAEEKDSVRIITAKVLAFQDSSWIVVPETEIKLVVRRLLSDIKVGEDDSFTTDDDGVASTEFNLTIPGDGDGNIFIGAKIDDNDTYGNLVTTKVMKWGAPLERDDSFEARTLWATRDKTPLWLLIFPNLIIASVWGIIFYLLYLITRIIKLGKTNESA
ncbi:MAG: hypothetical protein JJE09_01190 [Bacteroidia bacterium]|nr:hypothetical protein [Bacteroidia bacterium]